MCYPSPSTYCAERSILHLRTYVSVALEQDDSSHPRKPLFLKKNSLRTLGDFHSARPRALCALNFRMVDPHCFATLHEIHRRSNLYNILGVKLTSGSSLDWKEMNRREM